MARRNRISFANESNSADSGASDIDNSPANDQGISGESSGMPAQTGNGPEHVDPKTASVTGDSAKPANGRNSDRSTARRVTSKPDPAAVRREKTEKREARTKKNIAKGLQTAHFFVAVKVFNNPLFLITKDEADEMAESLTDFMSEFPAVKKVMSPKVSAALNLALSFGGVYVPRILAVMFPQFVSVEKPETEEKETVN